MLSCIQGRGTSSGVLKSAGYTFFSSIPRCILTRSGSTYLDPLLLHPSNSPDLLPLDFYLFSRLKSEFSILQLTMTSWTLWAFTWQTKTLPFSKSEFRRSTTWRDLMLENEYVKFCENQPPQVTPFFEHIRLQKLPVTVSNNWSYFTTRLSYLFNILFSIVYGYKILNSNRKITNLGLTTWPSDCPQKREPAELWTLPFRQTTG